MRSTDGVRSKRGVAAALLSAAMSFCVSAVALSAAGEPERDPARRVKTESPIKHVIILIGENRGTDHTFGVYKPKGKGQTISNLLSKGIVNEDGSPGPSFLSRSNFW